MDWDGLTIAFSEYILNSVGLNILKQHVDVGFPGFHDSDWQYHHLYGDGIIKVHAMDLGDATPGGCIFEAENFSKNPKTRSDGKMILPGYICIYFIRYIFAMTFPVCFCFALEASLLEAKSTQCHCIWGAFAEFLTLDFRA